MAEGLDAGWTARVDGRETRVLRVNGDRLGRGAAARAPTASLFVHRARGLRAGLALAALAAALLVAALLRGRRGARARVFAPV